jgi:hypothetical protein
MVEARGADGTLVRFDGQIVSIDRQGRSRFIIGKGEKRIPVRAITAIQLKPAGLVVQGFIQFTLGGAIERRSRWGSQTNSAATDENSVVFWRNRQADFEALRAAVEAAMVGGTAQQAGPSAQGDADQLHKLHELRTAGVISDDEFVAFKARILGV